MTNNNYIYSPKKDQSEIVDDKTVNTFYCLKGCGNATDENNNHISTTEDNKAVCAKKLIRLDNTIKYLIKTGDDRKLYNPTSIYGAAQNRSFLETISRNQNSFKEVNHTVFNLYLRFLKTKNIAYLNQAERGI
jgi:hypothetical protein